jgi:hypothetical protein
MQDAAEGPADASGSDAAACLCSHGTCHDASVICTCAPGYRGAHCEAFAWDGDGRDGPLVVGAARNLSTENQPARTCLDGGDAVAYSVLEIMTPRKLRLAQAPRAGCLLEGDEVLLTNLQGTPGASPNTGHLEFLRVSRVQTDVVEFSSDKQLFYGATPDADDGLGTTPDAQRVIMQRVPQYTDVTITAAQTLTANAWNGQSGGVLAFRAAGRLLVAGRLDMAARGYRGGATTRTVSSTGQSGESTVGVGNTDHLANAGGGAGGAGDGQCGTAGFPGGGGAHASLGLTAPSGCGGAGGAPYAMAGVFSMGSGGGAGGTDNTFADSPPGGFGGPGGGLIAVFAREIHVFGAVDASGAAGEGDGDRCSANSTTGCFDYAGAGGGGAGGRIYLEGELLALGENRVRAAGGAGGDGVDAQAGNGGAGGVGAIVVQKRGELSGTSIPAAQITE